MNFSMSAVSSLQLVGNVFWYLPLYQQDSDGDTQLHLCIAHLPLHKNATKHLINVTWPPSLLDIQNHDGITALHLSAMGNDPEMVRHLLIAGAYPMRRSNSGHIPLHYACKGGDVNIILALTKPLNTSELSTMNAKKLMTPNLSETINARTSQGETPLHLAVEDEHLDAMKLLIDIGAKLDTIDYKNGRRPLYTAIMKGNKQITKFILKYYRENPNDELQNQYCCPELMVNLKLMGLDGAFIKILKIPIKRLYPQNALDDE